MHRKRELTIAFNVQTKTHSLFCQKDVASLRCSRAETSSICSADVTYFQLTATLKMIGPCSFNIQNILRLLSRLKQNITFAKLQGSKKIAIRVQNIWIQVQNVLSVRWELLLTIPFPPRSRNKNVFLVSPRFWVTFTIIRQINLLSWGANLSSYQGMTQPAEATQ